MSFGNALNLLQKRHSFCFVLILSLQMVRATHNILYKPILPTTWPQIHSSLTLSLYTPEHVYLSFFYHKSCFDVNCIRRAERWGWFPLRSIFGRIDVWLNQLIKRIWCISSNFYVSFMEKNSYRCNLNDEPTITHLLTYKLQIATYVKNDCNRNSGTFFFNRTTYSSEGTVLSNEITFLAS